jgi:YD repeat-containing protein
MRLSVDHRTTYDYDGEVRFSAQYLHLTPVSNPSQRVLRWRIDAPGQLTEWRDAFGNVCHTLVVDKPVSTIEIAAHGQIETTDTSGVLAAEDGGPPLEVFLRETPLTRAETRIMDFAAPHPRYHSGYLFTEDESEDASHAWASAWVEDLGWVSFDVSNRTCGTAHHIGVAVGLDYHGVAPVRGVRHGGDDGETLSVYVRIDDAQQQQQ